MKVFSTFVTKINLYMNDFKSIYTAPLRSYFVLSSKINLFNLQSNKSYSLSNTFVSYNYRATRTSLAFWKLNVLFFILDTYKTSFSYNLTTLHQLHGSLKQVYITLLTVYKKTIGEGFIYLRGLFIICFIDATLTDDEPLWEPIEWSLVQSWIMFIFFFAWVAENLISSRYGSYTGRDKRVWFSWYKTFWWLIFYYLLTMGVVAILVITPFYNEITYTLPFVVSWWNWFTAVYFFKMLGTYSIVIYIAQFLLLNLRWFNWKKSFTLIVLINLFLFYLFYTQFFISFFAYFTDPNWYHKTRLVDYVQLSHEPNKWAWGAAKRDHFSYHNSKTVFWFKNDGKFAEAFLFCQFLLLTTLFMFIFYWVVLLRRVYVTQEVSYTYTVYCVSGLKQLFYFFMCLYVFVVFSFLLTYWRLPMEFLWLVGTHSWFTSLWDLIITYPEFVFSIFFK